MNLLIIFLFFSFPLLALDVKANHADYDGSKIRLSGDVHVQHEFGDIDCQKGVVLMAKNEDKHLNPERILLSGRVRLQLKDGSILTSDEADIDCIALLGVFTAEPPRKVEYLTRVAEANDAAPIKTKARAMRVKMKKSDTGKTEYIVEDVQAEGSVNIEYQIETDEATNAKP